MCQPTGRLPPTIPRGVGRRGRRVHQAILGYMRTGQLPTLAALNASFNDSHQVYEVGYVADSARLALAS